jgi:hypothetical protein
VKFPLSALHWEDGSLGVDRVSLRARLPPRRQHSTWAGRLLGCAQWRRRWHGHAAAFASLARARDAVATLRLAHGLPQGGALVWVRGGIYELTETLSFGPAQGGDDGAPVIFQAQPHEAVRIWGGHGIDADAFSPVTDSADRARLDPSAVEQVLVADLASLGISDFGRPQLRGFWHPLLPAPLEPFFDGQPLTLARWPNGTELPFGTIVDAGSVPRVGDTSNRGGIFAYSGDRPLGWHDPTEAWVTGFMHWAWADDSIRIASLDPIARTVTLSDPHLYGLASGQPWQQYHFENVLEELDAPGEWYLDRRRGRLFFWPPTPLAGQEIVVSMLDDPLVSIDGASNVQLRNLVFEYSRGMGVYIAGGDHNRVDHCTLRHLGTVGVSIGSEIVHFEATDTPEPRQVGDLQAHLYAHSEWDAIAGTDNGVVASEFSDLGAGAIILGGGNRPTLTPAGNFVVDNDIHDVSRLTPTRPAVFVHGVGLRVANNRIHGVPQQSIYLEGNDHLVELNEIYDGLHAADDEGAVYLGRDPSERGVVIRWNYLHDLGGGPGHTTGIYLDDGESGISVYGNVFYHVGSDLYGAVFTHAGAYNTIENNMFIECPVDAGFAMMSDSDWLAQFGPGTLWERRLLQAVDIEAPPYSTRYPALVGYYGAPQHPETNVLDNNVSFDCGMLRWEGQANWCTLRNNLETTSDPGFVDASNHNWALQPDAAVYQQLPSFAPIPFDQIGLHSPPGPQ